MILGGLFTSTLLNLFVTPALYLRFGKPPESATRSSSPVPPEQAAPERPPERAARLHH